MASLIHRDTTVNLSTSTAVLTSGIAVIPSDVVAGDFMVAKVFFAANAGSVTTPSAPAGWSSPAGNSSIRSIASLGSGVNNYGVVVFTKTAVAADAGATFTVDFTGLNIYNYGIVIDITYATDGVTPTLDGSIVFTYGDQVSQISLGLPILTQKGDFVYCSGSTYQGNIAIFSFGQWHFDTNNGIFFVADGPWDGPIPTVGYEQDYIGGGHHGGVGGRDNGMGLEGSYFGWHLTSAPPTPIMFATGKTTSMLGVCYALKASSPGAVFMGTWGPIGVLGGAVSSVTAGYMPGSAALAGVGEGVIIIAQVCQSINNGPIGQVVTPPAGWTRIGTQLIDSTGKFSQDLFWHLVTAGDPSTWTFSVPIATTLSIIIASCSLIDTTTPFEVVTSATQPSINVGRVAAGAIVAPSITPTGNDELLVWFWGCQQGNSFAGQESFSSGVSRAFRAAAGTVSWYGPAGIGYGGVENCGTQYCYNNNGSVQGPPGGAHTLALKASKPIVRPSANVRIDQMAIIAIGTAPGGGGGGGGGGGSPANYNDTVLLRFMGTSKGFSLLKALPGGALIITLKEVQVPSGGTGSWPLAGNGDASIIALTNDKNSYVLFAGAQDGTVVATAITQPLPTPSDIPEEYWDTDKHFDYLYSEGVDLSNFRVSFSLDGGMTFNIPQPLTKKFKVGMRGKSLTIKLTHAAATSLTPVISHLKLSYTIEGLTAQ